jgi:molecular chaperone GrpE
MAEEKNKPSVAKAPTGEGEKNTEELKKKLEECEKQKCEYLTGWQRERADFLNHKREEMERAEELLKYANEVFILKILKILDNFEIIEKKVPENLKKDENVKGLLMVKNQILDFLKAQSVEAIKSIGEKFDPNFHEAVGEAEIKPSVASAATGKGQESGIIIEEIQKGYKINGRLLRPAKVKVTK